MEIDAKLLKSVGGELDIKYSELSEREKSVQSLKNKIRPQMEHLKKRSAILQQYSQNLLNARTKLNTEITEFTKINEKSKNKINNIENKLSEQLNGVTRSIKEIKSKRKQYFAESKTIASQIIEYQNQLESLTQKNQKLIQKSVIISSDKLEKYRKTLTELIPLLSETKKHIHIVKNCIIAHNEDLNRIRESLQITTKRKSELTQEIISMKDKLHIKNAPKQNQSQSISSVFHNTKDHLKSIQEKNTIIDSYNKIIVPLRTKYEQHKTEYESIQAMIKQYNKGLEQKEKVRSKMNATKYNLKQKMMVMNAELDVIQTNKGFLKVEMFKSESQKDYNQSCINKIILCNVELETQSIQFDIKEKQEQMIYQKFQCFTDFSKMMMESIQFQKESLLNESDLIIQIENWSQMIDKYFELI